MTIELPRSDDAVEDGLRSVFAASGAMAPVLASMDWSSTTLGPPERWPQSLRSAASICLGAEYPIAIYWGEDLSLLYNEAWSVIPGARHPWALGRPGREVWPDIWHIVGPEFSRALAGDGTFVADRLLPMQRHGYLEETYFDYNLSPIVAEDGRIAGVFNAGSETTARVLSERRDQLLLELTGATSRVGSVVEVCDRVAEVLDGHRSDVPFALLYVFDEDASLVADTTASGQVTPASVELAGATPDPWRLREVARTRSPVLIRDPDVLVGAISAGDWPEPATAALALPVMRGGPRSRRGLLGVLVVAVPPGLVIDDAMRRFHDRLGDTVATAIIDARRDEEERRLFAVEHRIATTLQESLLPTLPELESVRIEGRYLPGSVDVEVGGDWFDAYEQADGEVSIVIGDVVGKGVAAAAQMGQIRNAMRAYILEGFGPGQIIERLNRLTMSMASGHSTFATVLAAAVDPATCRLRWCRAGHLPALIRSADGAVRFLDQDGSPPIGVFADARFVEAAVDLVPGDVVVLFTDGLVERRGERIDEGMDRLADVVSGLEPAGDMAGAIVAALAGADRRDDIAVLALHT